MEAEPTGFPSTKEQAPTDCSTRRHQATIRPAKQAGQSVTPDFGAPPKQVTGGQRTLGRHYGGVGERRGEKVSISSSSDSSCTVGTIQFAVAAEHRLLEGQRNALADILAGSGLAGPASTLLQ